MLIMNLYPITVVDNFYDDPDAVRKFALSQKYQFRHELKGELPFVFPGSRTKDLSVINKPLFEKVAQKISALFHNVENDRFRWSITTNFQSVSAEYGRGIIHYDNAIFAAVLYLSPDAPLDSGTSLFKPNKSFDQERYDASHKENHKNFLSGNVKMDASYHAMFDEIVRVNNVYNTLILYEGQHFHAANDFFGQNLKDARLTQVFFVNKIDAQQHSSFPVWRSQQIKV